MAASCRTSLAVKPLCRPPRWPSAAHTVEAFGQPISSPNSAWVQPLRWRSVLPAGFALVIRGGCAPVIARLPRAWRNPAYRRARRLHAGAQHELPPAPQWSEPVIPRHVPAGTFLWN